MGNLMKRDHETCTPAWVGLAIVLVFVMLMLAVITAAFVERFHTLEDRLDSHLASTVVTE